MMEPFTKEFGTLIVKTFAVRESDVEGDPQNPVVILKLQPATLFCASCEVVLPVNVGGPNPVEITVSVTDVVAQLDTASQTLTVNVLTPVAAVPVNEPFEASVAHPGNVQVVGQVKM